MFIVVVLVLVQVYSAYRLYGVLPILAFASGYSIGAVNRAQDASGFGQLGLLRITASALNGLILAGFASNIGLKVWGRRVLRSAILISIFSAVFGGKTQGVFILACMLFTGLALMGANPIKALFSKGIQSVRELRGRTILGAAILLIVLALLHAGVHYIRSPGQGGFGAGYACQSIVNYLSYPLMNMERQIEVGGIIGGESSWQGVLIGLLPHKARREFMTHRDLPDNPRVEPTSPSGFLALPHWCLGIGWMLVFMFGVGVTCQWLYIQSARSLFCVLAYSHVAWTLVAAHSYNHFLALIFLPAPVAISFVLARLVCGAPATGVSDNWVRCRSTACGRDCGPPIQKVAAPIGSHLHCVQ